MTALKRETILYAAATTVGGLAMLAFLPFMSASLSAGEAGAVGSLRTLADVVAGIAVLGAIPASAIATASRVPSRSAGAKPSSA